MSERTKKVLVAIAFGLFGLMLVGTLEDADSGLDPRDGIDYASLR